MSLEAARTRARVRAAYLAQFLPADGCPTLLGYEILPIRSPAFSDGSLQDLPVHGPPAEHAGAGPALRLRLEKR